MITDAEMSLCHVVSDKTVAVRTPDVEKLFTTSPTFSSVQHAITTVMIPRTHQPVHKSRSGLEEMDSEGKMSEKFQMGFKKKFF